MRNKIVGILLSLVVALGFAGTVSAAPNEKAQAPEKAALEKYKPEFHVGEKPEKTFIDKNTKVRVDVYPSSDPETEVNSLTSGWDLVGTDYWTMNGQMDQQWDAMFYSTGGDYMFRVPAHESTWWTDIFADCNVILYENDGPGANTKVASWVVNPEPVSYDYVVRSISGYVDGTNAKAEFHTMHSSGYKTANERIDNVRYYD